MSTAPTRAQQQQPLERFVQRESAQNLFVGGIEQTGSFKFLLIEKRERVLIIKFNRPEKKNALNRRCYYELLRVIVEARYDDTITVIVLTGVGDYFSSGLDLSQFAEPDDREIYTNSANFIFRFLVGALVYCPKILVALVNGPCVGVGFTLCALCDVVYCTEEARFNAPFTRVGLCPEACSSYTFPRIMGRSTASDVLIFGRELAATEALQANFVARIYRTADLDAKFWPEMVEKAALPWECLRIAKQLISDNERQSLISTLSMELKQLTPLRKSVVFQRVVEDFLNRRANKNKSKL